MRVGMGYDVHRLTEGRDLILGGVKIPYEKGLLGHSDADVLLHAIMDALLGAAALGDIGKHFPDTDEKYKGIISDGYEAANIIKNISLLDPSKRYLFISNHRDIVLDSCLLMYILHYSGHRIGEITFGSNLMKGQMVIDIGKSNKMFRVERGGNPRQMYLNSLHLSDYIRYAITEKQESVWIAQRNGRTKDGIDRTDQGLIKMLSMSGGKDRVKALSDLNIVPVSVSYEWESCDILKALELYASRDGKPYVKKPGEDLNSILTGIMQPKGRVHIQICKPLTADDLNAIPADYVDAQFRHSVAEIMDKRICDGYRLFPNAYIAHDIRSGKREYSRQYTQEQYDAFVTHMKELDKYQADDVLKDIFLGIYANPIDSKMDN